jgi:hypothetical protein
LHLSAVPGEGGIMTTFRIAKHSFARDRAAVEIIGEDGQLLATLYATDDHHFRLVSKHLDRVEIERTPPAVAEIYLRKP